MRSGRLINKWQNVNGSTTQPTIALQFVFIESVFLFFYFFCPLTAWNVMNEQKRYEIVDTHRIGMLFFLVLAACTVQVFSMNVNANEDERNERKKEKENDKLIKCL